MDERGRPSARRYIDPWKCARPAAHSPSYVICLDCPRPWRSIPYQSFHMPHHVRVHLRTRLTHRLAFWCEPHQAVEDGLTGKSPPTEIVGRYPLPCDHCGGRRSFHRDTRTGPVFLQCEGCFCEWSVRLVLSYKGSVCPTRREEVA